MSNSLKKTYDKSSYTRRNEQRTQKTSKEKGGGGTPSQTKGSLLTEYRVELIARRIHFQISWKKASTLDSTFREMPFLLPKRERPNNDFPKELKKRGAVGAARHILNSLFRFRGRAGGLPYSILFC